MRKATDTMTRLLMATALILAAGLGTSACAGATIENTDIPDTETNREILQAVHAYREAMEARDSDALLGMVSRRYYENAGTTDSDVDDYGYEILTNKVIPKLHGNIRAVLLRIIPRRVEVDGDRAWADYEYFYRFKYVEGGREGWSQKNDFNRLEFVMEDGSWKIIGGL